ncbi:MAG TPA: hypothetical protein VI997_12410 [Candidatus Thermoplasmatota archaeon]|nr:hypothetical protein [Candidatus Thermoplasmatota archaeon]
MESIVWTIDWNPEWEGDNRLKRDVLKALKDDTTISMIKRFAEQSVKEAVDLGLETEHIVWLDSSLTYAFFVRVWYETSESKLFIIIEENDLGDVGFLLLNDLDCASYNEESLLKVEFKDPEDYGVSR